LASIGNMSKEALRANRVFKRTMCCLAIKNVNKHRKVVPLACILSRIRCKAQLILNVPISKGPPKNLISLTVQPMKNLVCDGIKRAQKPYKEQVKKYLKKCYGHIKIYRPSKSLRRCTWTKQDPTTSSELDYF